MSSLAWILSATLMGGVLSVLMAGAFAYAAHPRWVPRLVSFAVGTLLGAGFLEVLPHALEKGPAESVAVAVLAGLLAFFVLEKLVLWRHCHHETCEVHGLETPEHTHDHAHDHGHNHAHAHGHQEHDHGHQRAGLMILVGDTFHNFVDGVLIAAAFLTDVHLGIVTAIAVAAHEIPQEVGDFAILLHGGFTRTKALAYNVLASLTTVIGGVLAYFSLTELQSIVPYVLAIAASSFIYIAVADLIPGLHKRLAPRATLEQLLLIGAGVIVIHFAHATLH